MVYVVFILDPQMGPKNPINYLGFTDNKKYAEKYKEFEEENLELLDEMDGKIGIKTYSDKMFFIEKEKNQDLRNCPQIMKVNKDLYINEDQYDFLESSLGERVDEFDHRIGELIKTAQLFDDPEAKEFVRLAKRLKKRFKIDYAGEDIFATFNFKRATKIIIL